MSCSEQAWKKYSYKPNMTQDRKYADAKAELSSANLAMPILPGHPSMNHGTFHARCYLEWINDLKARR